MAKTFETKRKWKIRKETIYDKKKFDSSLDYSQCMEIIHVKDFFGTYMEAKAEELRLLKEAGEPKHTIFYASVFETKEIRKPMDFVEPPKKVKKKKC